MGIHSLFTLIKRFCPEQIIPIDFEKLRGLRVGVDITGYLYRCVKSCGLKTHDWMGAFIIFLCTLKRYQFQVVCVFDGSNHPIEKSEEQQSRRDAAKRDFCRLKEIIELNKFVCQEIIFKKDISKLDESIKAKAKGLINPGDRGFDITDYDDPVSITEKLDETVDKLEKRCAYLTEEEIILAQEIVKLLGFSCLQADGEAETVCVFLQKIGRVDAVMSEDGDVLAYGCESMLCLKKNKISKGSGFLINHTSLIESLDLTKKEFLDLCVLLGCDYNTHLKGMGPTKALKLISTHSTIEDCGLSDDELSLLKYERCRELLTTPEVLPGKCDVIVYSKPPNYDGLAKLLHTYDLKISVEYIRQSFPKSNLVFE